MPVRLESRGMRLCWKVDIARADDALHQRRRAWCRDQLGTAGRLPAWLAPQRGQRDPRWGWLGRAERSGACETWHFDSQESAMLFSMVWEELDR